MPNGLITKTMGLKMFSVPRYHHHSPEIIPLQITMKFSTLILYYCTISKMLAPFEYTETGSRQEGTTFTASITKPTLQGHLFNPAQHPCQPPYPAHSTATPGGSAHGMIATSDNDATLNIPVSDVITNQISARGRIQTV